jgi:hypothetical protein
MVAGHFVASDGPARPRRRMAASAARATTLLVDQHVSAAGAARQVGGIGRSLVVYKFTMQ